MEMWSENWQDGEKTRRVEIRFAKDDDGPILIAVIDIGKALSVRKPGKPKSPYESWVRREPEIAKRRKLIYWSQSRRTLNMLPVQDIVNHLNNDAARSEVKLRERLSTWICKKVDVTKQKLPPPVGVVWADAIISGTSRGWSTEETIGKYRVDLYHRKSRIVVEIDELGHSSYSAKAERERTEYLMLQNIQIIRVNPHEKGANIYAVVAYISAFVGCPNPPIGVS